MSPEAERTTHKLRIDPHLTRVGRRVRQFRAGFCELWAIKGFQAANELADSAVGAEVTQGPQGVGVERYPEDASRWPRRR